MPAGQRYCSSEKPHTLTPFGLKEGQIFPVRTVVCQKYQDHTADSHRNKNLNQRGRGMAGANKATCNFVISYWFSLLSSALTFSFLRYAGFPFILIFCEKLSSHNYSAWQKQNKTKRKPLELHTSFKKLLLSATLICNRSAPSSDRIFSRGQMLANAVVYTALIPTEFSKQNADLANHHNKFSSLWAISFIKRYSELSFNLEYSQYI